MRRPTAVAIVVALVVAAVPRPAVSWGFDVHRFIVERAIELLPDPMRPFYRKHRAFVVEHSIDPDLWRTAGWAAEPPRHFIDLDAYGPYPFAALPRDYETAIKKFGRERVEKNGLLPWRTVEMYDRLVKTFESQRQGTSPYALDEVKFLSAVIAHYVSDAHVPFHAVLNHDGQLTNQHGIHSRFETELFGRYQTKLAIAPPVPHPVQQPRDVIFGVLLSGFQLADPILKADRQAVEGRDEYDDVYFDRFLKGAGPILERRIGEAIAGVASVLIGAWERGGRPHLPLHPPRVNRKVKRPNP